MIQVTRYRACKRTVFWFFLYAFGLEAAFKYGLHAVSGICAANCPDYCGYGVGGDAYHRSHGISDICAGRKI